MTSCRKGLWTENELKKHLAEEVVELVVGAGKEDLETREERKEQIVLIRLATRLHNMRTIDYMDGRKENGELKKPARFLFHWLKRLEIMKLQKN